jgi:hypothetical protein
MHRLLSVQVGITPGWGIATRAGFSGHDCTCYGGCVEDLFANPYEDCAMSRLEPLVSITPHRNAKTLAQARPPRDAQPRIPE